MGIQISKNSLKELEIEDYKNNNKQLYNKKINLWYNICSKGENMVNGEKLTETLIKIGKISNIELDVISNDIDEIIKLKIEDEKIISCLFDRILNLVFVGDENKREVFYKLSNYCRKFNKELSDEYDKILEEILTDDYEEKDKII